MSEKNYLPGLKPVVELLEQSPEAITKIFCRKGRLGLERVQELAEKNKIPLEFVPDNFLVRQMGKDFHSQGILASLASPPTYEVNDIPAIINSAPLPLILALDQLQDPGNVGALCRTAWALGVGGMLLPRHNSANFGIGVARSSAGAFAHMPICVTANLARALDTAEENGVAIIGTFCGAVGIKCEDAYRFSWPLPGILVVGNEDKGLRPGVLKRCQYILKIPFARKFDSINAAQAGGILMALCASSYRMPE